MKILYALALTTTLFSLSGFTTAIACSKERQCSTDELLHNISVAYNTCRDAIAKIENVKKDVFEPKISSIHIRTKSKLKELNKKLDFETYLVMVNDLKENNVRAKTQATKMVNEWTDLSTDGLNKLALKVSEDLRASASFCVQPTSFIQQHINDLKEVVKGKTK